MDKQITQITILRSKFKTKQALGVVLWHASVQVVVDGQPEFWQFGKYDGTKGSLHKRNPSKKHNGQQIVTSCKLINPIDYSQFTKSSTEYCKGKTWSYTQSQSATNCHYYALKMVQKYTTQQCTAAMKAQIQKNWIKAVQQAASEFLKKFRIGTARSYVMDLLLF